MHLPYIALPLSSVNVNDLFSTFLKCQKFTKQSYCHSAMQPHVNISRLDNDLHIVMCKKGKTAIDIEVILLLSLFYIFGHGFSF